MCLALGFGRRKFRCRTAGMCPVRHVAWYAWAKAGVIPVMKRILPLIYNHQSFQDSRYFGVDDGHKQMRSMKPNTTIPYWRLRRNTWVIRSCKRWFLRGKKCLQKDLNISSCENNPQHFVGHISQFALAPLVDVVAGCVLCVSRYTFLIPHLSIFVHD